MGLPSVGRPKGLANKKPSIPFQMECLQKLKDAAEGVLKLDEAEVSACFAIVVYGELDKIKKLLCAMQR